MTSLTPVVNYGTDMHGFAEEGSYFCVQNAQTGIASPTTGTTFSDTAPFISIYNKDNAKSIYLDFLKLVATAAGTAAAQVLAAAQIDMGVDRYTSGGTDLTPNINCVNGGKANVSIAKVRAGVITASAKTAAARMIFGEALLLPAIPAAFDTMMLKFGAVDQPLVIQKVTNTFTSQGVPKIVIPPQSSCLIHLWFPSQSGASSYIPEMGWVER